MKTRYYTLFLITDPEAKASFFLGNRDFTAMNATQLDFETIQELNAFLEGFEMAETRRGALLVPHESI